MNLCNRFLTGFSARPRWPLFSSDEEELVFLEEYGLDVAQSALLEKLRRYSEAAEVHLSGDRPLDAIKDLLKAKGSHNAIRRATKVMLDELWRRCSFGVSSEEVAANQDVVVLLNLVPKFPVDFLDPLDRHEVCFSWEAPGTTLLTCHRYPCSRPSPMGI